MKNWYLLIPFIVFVMLCDSYDSYNYNTQELQSSELTKILSEFDSELIGIFKMNTNACSVCVTNAVKFIEESENYSEFEDFIFLFIDEDSSRVARFTSLSGIDYPILNIESKNVDNMFITNENKLIVISNDNKVVGSVTIPTSHQPLSKINYEIRNFIQKNKQE